MRYTPASGYAGADSFTYMVSDGRGGTAAATVSVTVQSTTGPTVRVDNGRLVIAGGAGRDVISITGVGDGKTGRYVIETNQTIQTVSGVTADMRIDLFDGDDEVVIDNAYVNGTITIISGGGDDQVRIGLRQIVSTRLDLNVSLGDGDDHLQGSRLYIGRNQSVSGGQGDDQIAFLGAASAASFVLGTSSGGVATFAADGGADTLRMSYSFIVGRLWLDGGADNDTADVRMSAVVADLNVIGGSGADTLTVNTNYCLASVLINAGEGDDQLDLRNSLGMLLATLEGGAGNDNAVVSNLKAGRLALNLGAQNDKADVRSCLLDSIFANLGANDDSLTVYGNLVRGMTETNGAEGSDLFANLGNQFLGGIRYLSFER